MIVIMSDIALLYGGRSGEHEVSCTSAASVLKNLNPSHRVILIGISREGAWYLQKYPQPIPAQLSIDTDENQRVSVRPAGGLFDAAGQPIHVDAALPIVHGSYGEDGRLQGLLEIADIPYAGAGVLGSALGMDKDLSKRIWKERGLPVVPWRTVVRNTSSDTRALAESLLAELGVPLFIKPANAGSSVGVSRVENIVEIENGLKQAWRHDRKVLVEQAIIGREIECAVSGYHEPEAYPLGEIIPAGTHSFYDYDAKYLDPDGALLQVPADLPPELSGKIRSIALEAYKAVDAGGLARVDFLVDKNDNTIFINEINTLPGMTGISLFPRMAAAGGVDFRTMLDRMIDGALAEGNYRKGLSYER